MFSIAEEGIWVFFVGVAQENRDLGGLNHSPCLNPNKLKPRVNESSVSEVLDFKTTMCVWVILGHKLQSLFAVRNERVVCSPTRLDDKIRCKHLYRLETWLGRTC